jgi:hypothetical protein
MTVSFNCPWCGGLCAFRDAYAGRRARCQKCWRLFVIPAHDGDKAEKIKEKAEIASGPYSGFYRAVLTDSWKLFIQRKNAAGLVFITTVVCFKFIFRHQNYEFTITSLSGGYSMTFHWPIGLIITAMAFGCLFWYYMQIVYSTAFETDNLPMASINGLRRFLQKVFGGFYTFFMAVAAVELPCIIAAIILKKMEIEMDWLLWLLGIAGLFLFPMVVLSVSICKDLLAAIRPDSIFAPIISAPKPYLVTAGIVMAAAAIQWITFGHYGVKWGQSMYLTGWLLVTDIASALFMTIAMRTIGLFYRHYNCYLRW